MIKDYDLSNCVFDILDVWYNPELEEEIKELYRKEEELWKRLEEISNGDY